MNLEKAKSNISLELAAEPQKQAKADAAFDGLRAGIAELAALGYRFAVVEEFGSHEPQVPDEFPKMLYRRGAYPTEITVDDEVGEEKARADGYGEHPSLVTPVPEAKPAANQSADVKTAQTNALQSAASKQG